MNVLICYNQNKTLLADLTKYDLEQIDNGLKDKSLSELGLNVEYLDLNDKEDVIYDKLKSFQPDYIYMEDIKDDIRQYIEKNYPDSKLVDCNENNGITYEEISSDNHGGFKHYILANSILKTFNNTLERKDVYLVNTNTPVMNLNIDKAKITELTKLDMIRLNKANNNSIHIFDSIEDAEHFILDRIKDDIKETETRIQVLKGTLKQKEREFKKEKMQNIVESVQEDNNYDDYDYD